MATNDAASDNAIIQNPAFRTVYARRSRLRWGFTILLCVAYFTYAMAGLYFPAVVSRPFMGTAISWSMFVGYVIIFMSIVLAIAYVSLSNKLNYDLDALGRRKP